LQEGSSQAVSLPSEVLTTKFYLSRHKNRTEECYLRWHHPSHDTTRRSRHDKDANEKGNGNDVENVVGTTSLNSGTINHRY
jgi:hypothetical protein